MTDTKVLMHPTLLAALHEALEEKSIVCWREIAEQTRDELIAGYHKERDADILHSIREPHLAFGAACAYNAAQELEAALARAHELDELFDVQFAAQMRAVDIWRAKNPGNELVLPDGAELIHWLLVKVQDAPK